MLNRLLENLGPGICFLLLVLAGYAILIGILLI
jgi:hypothetical protein